MSFHIKIGNYRFSKNLGTGSFGKVKMAFNEVTGTKVAIKILNKKKIKQQGVFEKVKREIKVLRLFNHPHIIKHYEFIDTPSDIFLVIEYAAGGELFDIISKRERLEEYEARRYFQQIISSIEYSHAHKIAHRDLKPENLLLDENNNIKLIDFGLANSMRDSHSLKTACGSPNYAAPEVISAKSYGGMEVDVWSVGVILYAMVCGSLPFDDESMSQLFHKIKDGKFYMPNYISSDVKDLINRMLQPNPIKRITIAEIKQHPWYLVDLPEYLIELSNTPLKKEQDIDHELVQKLFTSYEEVTKSIRDKKNCDFCGIYEILHHDQLKKLCQEKAQKESIQKAEGRVHSSRKQFKVAFPKRLTDTESDQFQQDSGRVLHSKHQERLRKILEKMKNGKPATLTVSDQKRKGGVEEMGLTPSTSSASYQHQGLANTRVHSQTIVKQSKAWQFGVHFRGNPADMIKLACQILEKLGPSQHYLQEWQQVPKEINLKIRTKVDDEQLIDDDEVIKEFLRKNFLKLFLSIYRMQAKNNEDQHMLDLQLFKGNLLVFDDFIQKFLKELHSSCSHVSYSSSPQKGVVLPPLSQEIDSIIVIQ